MTCPNCNSTFDNPIDNCTKCRYPFNGTDNEKSSFIAQQILKVGEIDDAKESITTAKRILFIIGGINIILPVFSSSTPTVMVLSALIGLVFIVFGFIVQKNPFLFLVIPLSLLLLLYISDALIDPMTIMRGAISKVVFIMTLTYGIIRVKRAEKIKKESEYLGQQ